MKSCFGVVAVSGIVLAKVAERIAVEVPLVRRIAKRAEIRVVRRNDEHFAAGAHQPVEFLDGFDHVRNVLDDVDRLQPIERAIAEWIRKAVELHKNVRFGAWVAIDSNGPDELIDSAADV